MEESNADPDATNEPKGSLANVPQDALGTILSILPGRVVFKLRRVCKFWRDIIEDRSFVDQHLSNSLRFQQSIAYFTSVDGGLVHMYTFDPRSVNFKSVELVLSNRFHMSDPCNGLVCSYDLEGSVEVLNPTMQRYLSLPDSGLKSQSLSSEYFLAFVDSTKEYKVVSVRHRMKYLTFEICTVGSLSWRIVRESAELLKTKAVVVKSSMYWLLRPAPSSMLCQEILMLNLIDENFTKIALPHTANEYDLSLLEGEGKLYLLSKPANSYNDSISDIWVLDHNEQIWVQLDLFAPRVPVGMNVLFLCNMKIFCGSQDMLAYIDLLDSTVSYIPMPSGESLISCGIFVESLAPAARGLLNSTASSSSHSAHLTEVSPSQTGPSSCGSESSLGVLKLSSDLIGWSRADLKRCLERAKRTVTMKWEKSTRGLLF